MLVIRLLRTGKKNQPFFQIVVTDKKNPPKGGRFVEKIGFWNPLTKEKKIDVERVKHWLSKGVQLSDTVHNFLVDEKIIEGKKISQHNRPKEKQEEKKEVPTESKPEEAKPEEVKTEEVKPEETKAENITHDEEQKDQKAV